MSTIVHRCRCGREEASADSTIVVGGTAIIEDVMPTNHRGIGMFCLIGDNRGSSAQRNSFRNLFLWQYTLFFCF